MKLTAVHDRHGNIVTLVASGDDVPPPQPEIKAGQYFSEISAPEISEALHEDMGEELIFKRLEELMEKYQVDTEGNRATFARKS